MACGSNMNFFWHLFLDMWKSYKVWISMSINMTLLEHILLIYWNTSYSFIHILYFLSSFLCYNSRVPLLWQRLHIPQSLKYLLANPFQRVWPCFSFLRKRWTTYPSVLFFSGDFSSPQRGEEFKVQVPGKYVECAFAVFLPIKVDLYF